MRASLEQFCIRLQQQQLPHYMNSSLVRSTDMRSSGMQGQFWQVQIVGSLLAINPDVRSAHLYGFALWLLFIGLNVDLTSVCIKLQNKHPK